MSQNRAVFRPRLSNRSVATTALALASLSLPLVFAYSEARTVGTRQADASPNTAFPPDVAPRTAHLAPDTVRGIVFDSLAGEALVDAFITAEPGGANTTSDSLGRFTLVSDTRIVQVTAFHQSLDETGISGLTAVRPADAARWTDVQLTTPSLATVWRAVCSADVPESDNRGVIVGTAVQPDNATREDSARVRVQFQVTLPSTGLSQIQERESRTDSLGTFAVCGTPTTGEMAILSTTAQLSSTPVLFELMTRPIRRVDLVMAPNDAPVSQFPTLSGQITSEDGTPIAGALVNFSGMDTVVQSGPDGAFSVPSVPLGSRMLAVQAAGHVTVSSPVNVLYENNPTFGISMTRTLAIAGLEGITITERTSIRAARRAYEERRRAGVAQFVDSSEIVAAGSLRAVLAQVPFLSVERAVASEDSTHYDVMARAPGFGVDNCRAFLFLDGAPVEVAAFYELTLPQIATLEIYRSAIRVPPPFSTTIDRDCSAVLVWTQYGLRP